MMNHAGGKQARKVALAMAVLLAGCGAPSDRSPPGAVAVDLDAELARASAAGRPIVLVVIDPSQRAADAEVLLDASMRQAKDEHLMFLVLDLGVSRNRATAARFHITDTNTPLLVCLTPRGIIVSREERPRTKGLVHKRIEEVARRAPPLDAQRAALEEAVAKRPKDAAAQWVLAEFLLAQHNAREAVMPLAAIAHAETADVHLRVTAWAALARAHLWIAEVEKGRHAANDLLATLAAKTPEALAGAKLVYGLLDARSKRTALARQEFTAAIAAAPQSSFAKEAAEELAKLPHEEK